MNRFLLTSLSVLAIMGASAEAKAQAFTDEQRTEIKKMFDEYLANSGEKVLESVNNYQAAIEAEDRAEAAVRAKEFLESAEKKNLPMAGNPDGDVTMIEFFDYNCGYCRKALDEIQTVLKEDENVKVIFMDMPILGPSSVEAAKWSLAAHKQGKYFEYHQAIMDHNGDKTSAALEKLAKDLELDVDKLKKDKDNADITKQIEDQVKQAQEIGIRGTPGFIVAGELFPGYIPASQIQEIIAKSREESE